MQQSVHKEARQLSNIKTRKYHVVFGDDQGTANVVDQLGRTAVTFSMNNNQVEWAIIKAHTWGYTVYLLGMEKVAQLVTFAPQCFIQPEGGCGGSYGPPTVIAH